MSNKNLISAILGGAAIGAAVGLLLAPQSGKETRQKIRKLQYLPTNNPQGKNSWYEVKGKAKENAGVAADELDDFIGHILQSGKKWWKSAKNKAGDVADEAGDAADRMAYKANNMADRGAEMARNAVNKVENAADRAGDHARNTGNRTENAINTGADQAKRAANDVKDRIS